MSPENYTTSSGIVVSRTISHVAFRRGLRGLLKKLDTHRGIYLSSGYEFPGRYSRWDIAAVAPPLEIVAKGRDVTIRALNPRGEALIKMLEPVLAPHPHWEHFAAGHAALNGRLKPLPPLFPEEERSKQPSAFSILRALLQEFKHALASRLALVGAFGYDLLLQFDPIERKLPRHDVKDLHLFLCDDIYFMDRKKERIERYQFDFAKAGTSTKGLPHAGERIRSSRKAAGPQAAPVSDHTPEEYMAKVETVREGMRKGDYYEVVLRQTFHSPYSGSPSELFEKIQHASPSPYEFFLQLGDEQLIGASPEMFVRIEGRRVETCPISGTARRTGDPLKDADNIRELLDSKKEESELTMCTDVDRNDKSRIAVPGSVKVIGRRLIESYAGVFHTVDHVEGTLAEGFDSLDAFLTHMWAVTVIGAPKKWAAQAIENLEKERAWLVRRRGGDDFARRRYQYRHHHSNDSFEERRGSLRRGRDPALRFRSRERRSRDAGSRRRILPRHARRGKGGRPSVCAASAAEGAGVRLLLVDNEDCFIHTLANYARQTGAEVMTYRARASLSK